MNTTKNAIVSPPNHCRRLTFIAIVPPAQSALLGFRLGRNSTRIGDRGSTCTSVHKYLREYPYPQKWHNIGQIEPHSVTVSTLAPVGKCLLSALDRRVRRPPRAPPGGPRRSGSRRRRPATQSGLPNEILPAGRAERAPSRGADRPSTGRPARPGARPPRRWSARRPPAHCPR